jgi:hypothetical protein
MKKDEALKMRMAINAIIKLTDKDRYCVAIAERDNGTDYHEDNYELHLYLRSPEKSGLIELAMLARVIEDMGTHFLSCESTYDAGTEKGKDIRHSIKIW